MRGAPILLALALGACSFDQSGVPRDAAANAPDANVDAMVDAAACGTCMGNVLKGCQGQPDTTCALGCSMTPTAHCKEVVPSNGVPITDLSGGTTAGLVTVSSATVNQRREYTINTDTGEILDYGDNGFPVNATPATVRMGVPGLDSGMNFVAAGSVNVLAVDNVHIAADSVLYGFGTHPLVILSRNDVLIEGAIDFSAGCYSADFQTFIYTCGGPGGGDGATATTNAGGCGPGGDGATNHFSGGGGGAFADPGGPGGDISGTKGGAGGSKSGCPGATLIPLVGGSGGGQGAVNQGGEGGGGGGALQITSLTKITITHPAQASNPTELYFAGTGGRGTPTTDHGGGGGGAGGAVLLEAPDVIVHATIAANGGGGGGGRIVDPTADGESGTSTSLVAQGGVGDGTNGLVGHGGFGGAGGNPPAQGNGTNGNDGTGGGGGAEGRVRLNTAPGMLDVVGGMISPPASQGPVVTQ